MVRFDELWVHESPHPDEVIGVCQLWEWGDGVFPGVSEARVVVIPDRRIAELPSEKLLRESGILPIGIGKGQFDDHPDGTGGKRGKCAAMLVAEVLGRQDDLALGRILKWVEDNDAGLGGTYMDLAYIVRALNFEHPDDPDTVCRLAFPLFRSAYHLEQDFSRTLEGLGEAELITVGNRSVLVVVSNDDQAARAARKRFKPNLLVLVTTDKHFRVFGYGLPISVMDGLMRALRAEEQREANHRGRLTVWKWSDLAVEGTHPSIPEWNYVRGGSPLALNGSATAKNVPPTRLSLRTVRLLAEAALDEDSFYYRCPISDGRQCIGKVCPRHAYGLKQCFDARRRSERS